VPVTLGSMGVVLALLPSPLLGPAAWQPVAAHLVKAGWTVVAPMAAQVAPGTPDDVLRSFLTALPADEDLVLIPHSNAGLYVPALTVARRVVACVFVDAGLPASYGRVRLAPPALLDVLTQKADDHDLLPPWTSWWDEADLTRLFPNVEVREQVEREQQRLPLSYFSQSLPVPSGWDNRPGAYLAFGDTYLLERQDAATRGWPVHTLSGGHLHMLVDPPRVAAEINDLLVVMGVRPNHGERGCPNPNWE
jgi:hypothetical protein